MKKIYVFILLAIAPIAAMAQCGVQVSYAGTTCSNTCDGFATAIPQGTGPYSFMWQPGNMTGQTVAGLCPGTYTVVMIDSGMVCTATNTFTIIAPQPLNAMVTTQPASCQSCCDGVGMGTATGGTPPYTYMWMPGNQFVPSVTNLCPGTYTFCVTDANGCVSCTTVVVNFMTGIEESQSGYALDCSPNPASDKMTIRSEIPAGDYSLSVYDLTGQLIETRSGTTAAVLQEELDLSAYPAGLYLVRLTAAGTVSARRFVRE